MCLFVLILVVLQLTLVDNVVDDVGVFFKIIYALFGHPLFLFCIVHSLYMQYYLGSHIHTKDC